MSSNRRDFFRQVIGKTLGQAAEIIGDQLPGQSPGQLPGSGVAQPRTRLRPPGAIVEAQFLDTCYRCGNCVDVCPAQAIQHVKGVSEEQNGTPYIAARDQPCLVCAGLECMHACPSGALKLVEREQIRMGLAVVAGAACLRSHGEDCRVCVEMCPYDEAAIRIDDSGTVQVLGGCVGCGICEWKCPVEPSAVVVRIQA